jgi:hypothetical protein
MSGPVSGCRQYRTCMSVVTGISDPDSYAFQSALADVTSANVAKRASNGALLAAAREAFSILRARIAHEGTSGTRLVLFRDLEIALMDRTFSEQPQRDSNPCLHLERVVSSATRRWGPVPFSGPITLSEEPFGPVCAGRVQGVNSPAVAPWRGRPPDVCCLSTPPPPRWNFGSGGRTRTPNNRARTCRVADYTTPELMTSQATPGGEASSTPPPVPPPPRPSPWRSTARWPTP